MARSSRSDAPLVQPADTRVLYAVIGGLLLLVGFGAGYIAGSEGRGRDRETRPRGAPHGTMAGTEAARTAGITGPPGGNGGASGAGHGQKRGHTFTGNIDVPAHGEPGHALAQQVLAGLACPCGGCSDMVVTECGCDTAKEIVGLTAHLLERGSRGDEVLAQVAGHYALDVPPAVLEEASQLSLSGAPPRTTPALGPGSGIPDDVSRILQKPAGANVTRPADVPTSARPKG